MNNCQYHPNYKGLSPCCAHPKAVQCPCGQEARYFYLNQWFCSEHYQKAFGENETPRSRYPCHLIR